MRTQKDANRKGNEVQMSSQEQTSSQKSMSSEDFGAVLGELTEPTPLADGFEIHKPQDKATRYWFSLRMHCSGFFVSKPVQVKPGDKLLVAKNAWNGIQRPEMCLWIIEALGMKEKAREVFMALHKVLEDAQKDPSPGTLAATARKLIDWDEVEKAARKEYLRLVYESQLPHRDC